MVAHDKSLDYFCEKRRRRKTQWALLAIIGVMIPSGFFYHVRITYLAERWYWSRQCMNHITPPGTILREDDPAKARLLVAHNPNYREWPWAGYSPQIENAAYCPVAWQQYSRFIDWPGETGGPIAFCGGRISPAGHHRLVVIGSGPDDVSDLPDGGWWVGVLSPPTLFGPGAASPFHWQAPHNYGKWQNWLVHLEPGAADPRDDSRLTIPFSLSRSNQPLIAEWHGTLDVYLENDDTLRFDWQNPAMSPEAK